MASRILARVLSKKLRDWTESYDILDNIQSRFRPNKSTGDVTQILVCIQEDAASLNARREQLSLPDKDTDPEARLLELQKAHPRVSKPVLRNILERYAMQGPFFSCLKDLHESTSYAVKGKEGDSE